MLLANGHQTPGHCIWLLYAQHTLTPYPNVCLAIYRGGGIGGLQGHPAYLLGSLASSWDQLKGIFLSRQKVATGICGKKFSIFPRHNQRQKGKNKFTEANRMEMWRIKQNKGESNSSAHRS